MRKVKWIQAANLKKGAFTRKAKAADETVPAFARQVLKKGSRATEKTKRQARTAIILRGLPRRRK